jgi:small-conductance mechanosensitive channel
MMARTGRHETERIEEIAALSGTGGGGPTGTFCATTVIGIPKASSSGLRDVPPWLQDWMGIAIPLTEAAIILVLAWLLNQLLRRLFSRLCDRYALPPEMAIGARRILGFVAYGAAILLILERWGVSGSVLWTALTGFTAVAAVAFFAAWSVLSNIFCTLLILTTRPFRLHDHIELVDNGDKPGLKGRVVDINLIYTTLQETNGNGEDTVLQIPNSQFFQRSTRRWRSDPGPTA